MITTAVMMLAAITADASSAVPLAAKKTSEKLSGAPSDGGPDVLDLTAAADEKAAKKRAKRRKQREAVKQYRLQLARQQALARRRRGHPGRYVAFPSAARALALHHQTMILGSMMANPQRYNYWYSY